jgi:hypothetical protein
LNLAADRLEEVTSRPAAGREVEWTSNATDALFCLQSAIGEHIQDCEDREGMLAHIDLTRPGMARQVGVLRQAHLDLPFLINMLLYQILSAGEAFSNSNKIGVRAGDLPPPRKPERLVDFESLRQSALDLVSILRDHIRQEVDLLQETVTTDLGAGD